MHKNGKLFVIDPTDRLRIKGILYEPTDGPLQLGDMVFDNRDGAYGIVDSIQDEHHVSLRDEWVVEVGCPIATLTRLKMSANVSPIQFN
jgi:hypothetical protein